MAFNIGKAIKALLEKEGMDTEEYEEEEEVEDVAEETQVETETPVTEGVTVEMYNELKKELEEVKKRPVANQFVKAQNQPKNQEERIINMSDTAIRESWKSGKLQEQLAKGFKGE